MLQPAALIGFPVVYLLLALCKAYSLDVKL